MRRTSNRKAVSAVQGKLFNCTNQLHSEVSSLLLELLENRQLLSTLPAPTVGLQQIISNGGTTINESTPSIAVDYNDPKKLIAVWQTNDSSTNPQMRVETAYSNDGGNTWNGMGSLDTLTDPNSSPDNPQPYATATDPSVAFVRQDPTAADGAFDQAYVVWREGSNDGGSGAILLKKFDFSGNTPSDVTVNPDTVAASLGEPGDVNVVYQWAGGDQAVQPMLAVDNNVATGTSDTDSNGTATTQDDPYAGSVYIAWTTIDQTVANDTHHNSFNPNEIRLIASSDGGNTFSTPIVMNASGHSGSRENYGAPSLVVSQGSVNGTVIPGQVNLVYDNFGANHKGLVPDNIIYTHPVEGDPASSNAGGATAVVGATFYPSTLPVPITDAIQGTGGAPDTPSVTDIPITVDLTKFPNFDTLTDIEVNLSIIQGSPQEISIVLVDPSGDMLTLLQNGEDSSGKTITGAGIQGGNLGVSPSGIPIGVTFDDDAEIQINNKNLNNRYNYVTPEGGSLRATFASMAASKVKGIWHILVTDNRNSGNQSPTPSVVDASLILTSHATPATALGGSGPSDPATTIVSTGVHETSAVPISSDTNASPEDTALNPMGIGPDPVIASDNTLGAYSEYQGRLYVAYVDGGTGEAANPTKVFMTYSDDGGATWNQNTIADPEFPLQTQDSAPVAPDTQDADGFSNGGRPQLEPQIAVDQATGTVVISYLDAVDDASQTRPAYYIVTSIDGGTSFSTPQFVNPPQTAKDAITNQTDIIGPIPANESANNSLTDATYGFGSRQGLAVYGGDIFPAWSTNDDGLADTTDPFGQSKLEIETVVATTASGPRIVSGTQGVIGGSTDKLNNTTTADGTPIAKSFIVQFDRPIDPTTFTNGDAHVYFRNPTQLGTDPGTLMKVTGVTALNQILSSDLIPRDIGSTMFRIDFTNPDGSPCTAAGTYMYTVGPYRNASDPTQNTDGPQDRIRTVGLKIVPVGAQQTFTATTGLPKTIPDATIINGGGIKAGSTSSSLAVSGIPAGQRVASLTVTVNITHTFDNDLEIGLQSPSGDTIPLAINRGGSGDNFTGTTFDDSAQTAIGDGSAPFTGSFRPEEALSNLQGIDPNGTWKLVVFDDRPGDTGKIVGWSLKIQPGTVSTTPQVFNGNDMDQNANGLGGEFDASTSTLALPSNDDEFKEPNNSTDLPLVLPGPHIINAQVDNSNKSLTVVNGGTDHIDVTFDRDMDTTAFTGADVITINGPTGAIAGPYAVALSPDNADPAHPRTFRISFPSQTLNGDYTIELGKNIYAKNVDSATGTQDQVDNNLNAGVDALRDIPSAGTKPITYSSTDSPQIGGTSANIITKSTIHVPDDYTIQPGTQVELNIAYTNDPDLIATLVSPPTIANPNGISIKLFTAVGNTGSKANFTSTILEDAAATNITNGGPPFFGTFQPQQPLSQVDGISAKGDWTLEIQDLKANKTGSLSSWSLTFQKPVSSTGLGEEVADRSTVNFKIFTMDPGNALSHSEWTELGPTSSTTGDGSVLNGAAGRVSAIAVDPSDPSGNTVYVGGSGGGVWKTTNFLTTDPNGPTYVPLTDFGPTSGMNISSIAVFGRNNDPDASEIFAATGDGNIDSTGVGMLRSMDGGKTWQVLDSSSNFDSSGTLLPMNSPSRNHIFVGTTSYKIAVDPNPSPSGDAIVYVALSDGTKTGSGGIWRSSDSGKTWQQMKAGNATDVMLDLNSAAAGNGNVNRIYGAFQGLGVFYSPNRGQTWNLMSGGGGNPFIQDANVEPIQPVQVLNDSQAPNSGGGRIVLASPAIVPGNVSENLAYEGYLYAAVANADGTFNGLYVTKDLGANWTQVQMPYQDVTFTGGFEYYAPTNNPSDPNYDVVSSQEARGGNYAMALAVDPTNPNILYLGGTADRKKPGPGVLRIDITNLADPHSLVAYDYTGTDGQLATSTTARIDVKASPDNLPPQTVPPFPSGTIPLFFTDQFFNLIRNPDAPFIAGSTLEVSDTKDFTNTGEGAKVEPFDTPLDPRNDVYNSYGRAQISSVIGSDQHVMITETDPTTGLPRLLLGNDQGVFSVIDQNGHFYESTEPAAADSDQPDSKNYSETAYEASLDTTPYNPNSLSAVTKDNSLAPSDTSLPAQGSRNGNLAIAQLNYGAVQPSDGAAGSGLANDVAGALVYGSGEGVGVEGSTKDVLTTGDTTWNSPDLNDFTKAVGVATDQQGDGTVYAYYYPSSQLSPTDFFQVNGVSRTIGLIQSADNGTVPDPQWPYQSTSGGSGTSSLSGDPTTLPQEPGNFTVNPLDGDQIVISSDDVPTGPHIFTTQNQGRQWTVIAGPADLDGTYAPTLTFGAPDPNAGTGNLNDYILAGTMGGKVFVTFTGGGSSSGNAWTNISNGLDGTPVLGITADPVRGTHDAYAVTQKGVYYMADTTASNPTWVNITGPTTLVNNVPTPAATNIFGVTHTLFGNAAQSEAQAKLLSSLSADWRYAIPNDPTNPTGPTHPVLYVGADSGVYRSLDQGQTWTLFPNQAVDGTPSTVGDGGLLPSVQVNDLDLSLGNINMTTGEPKVSTGPDLLVASTAGRGSFGIRVAPLVLNLGLQGGGTQTGSAQPTIVGNSEETAFGNTVTVNIYDLTTPASPVLIGTGTTDGTGKFAITLNPGFSQAGLRTVGAQATDDAGAIGPMSTFKLTVTVGQLSINNVSMNEGNSGVTNFKFTVSLSQAPTQTVTVQYATADGSATTADNDYLATSGTLTFLAGQTSQNITVQVKGDTNVESNETFTVNLTNPNGAALNQSSGLGTIINDDSAPTLSINNVSKNEGDTGTTAFTFNVTLSAAQSQQVTVKYATADNTATVLDNDYQATSGTLTFAPGVTTMPITVNVNGDTKPEGNETFFVNLSTPSANATLGTAVGTGTIVNDDAVPPTISINSVSKNEGNSGVTPYTFNVTLSNASNSIVTVKYATADGTATVADGDYAATSGTLTFAAGVTTMPITVNVNGDTKVESNESFTVNLSTPSSNASIAPGAGTGTGTIVNDDSALPQLTINNVSKTEGNSGTSTMSFTVTLATASTKTVTVKYATADGTATAADNDYVAKSGTLTFAPGTTTQTIGVTINGDTKVEANETFTVNLNSPVNAQIFNGVGTGTITNDDVTPPAPSIISIADASTTEGNSGTKNLNFTVTLTPGQTGPVTVKYATSDGSATTADKDYTAKSGTLTFNAGQTTATISVPIIGDTKIESNENFLVTLSNVSGNATLSDAQAVGTITNDDKGTATSNMSINNVTHAEGNSGTTNFTFTVTLDHSQSSTVTVKYATADGTASSSSDYTSKSGTLTFKAGQTSQTITVAVKGDKTVEPDEVFFVNLSSISGNAVLSDSQGMGTIQNDDAPPSSGSVTVVTDPTDSTKTALEIIGTSKNDTISVTGSDGNSTVTINGSNKGTFKYTGSIVIFGQDGNDTISVASNITRTVYAFGGAGNDVVNGGGGSDFLQGGDGNDTVNGNNGDDILVGNDGTDVLNGNAGNDVLIPGDFLNNPNFSVMASLHAEWTRTDIGYASKVSHLIGGGGKNKINLNPSTVFSSATLVDSVTGSSGQDLFVVAAPGDKITDLVAGETVENVGPNA